MVVDEFCGVGFDERVGDGITDTSIDQLLGECVGSEETANSYDHGSVHVRRVMENNGQDSVSGESSVIRVTIPRGGRAGADPRIERIPLRSREPMSVLANLLEDKGAVKPVAWLRPVANLSQD